MRCISIITEDEEEKMFRQVLLQIVDKHSSGTPRQLRLVLEDETVTLNGGEEFCTALIPEVMMKDI